jgi:hypothetical protein
MERLSPVIFGDGIIEAVFEYENVLWFEDMDTNIVVHLFGGGPFILLNHKEDRQKFREGYKNAMMIKYFPEEVIKGEDSL